QKLDHLGIGGVREFAAPEVLEEVDEMLAVCVAHEALRRLGDGKGKGCWPARGEAPEGQAARKRSRMSSRWKLVSAHAAARAAAQAAAAASAASASAAAASAASASAAAAHAAHAAARAAAQAAASASAAAAAAQAA